MEVATIATIDLDPISQQILEGIRGQAEETFREHLHFDRKDKDLFVQCELSEKMLLLGCGFTRERLREFRAAFLQIPAGIPQRSVRYPTKKTHYFVLGQREHFAEACLARMANGGGLHPAYSGTPIEVFPDVYHQFDVWEGGSLFLLRVQEA